MNMNYQVLIVDDEALAIRGIEIGVDWEKIGVSQVFTALNIRQAKEILKSQAIDIMLCDIEMPQGNGLELLAWVRDNHYQVETIILTCHADFDYARKALQLGSLDYMLKAMPYSDLEAIILRAIVKIEKDRELIKSSQYGELWQKNKPLLLEQFWADIATGKIPVVLEAIGQAAIERGIVFSGDIRVLPVFVYSVHPDKCPAADAVEKTLLEGLCTALMTEQQPERQLHVIQKGPDSLLFVITGLGDETFKPQNILPVLLKCSYDQKQQTACDHYFYVGNVVRADGLALNVSQLKAMAENDVAMTSNVRLLSEQIAKPVQIKGFDLNFWSDLIAEKAYGQLIDEVSRFLGEQVSSGSINKHTLQQFHQDFLQMIYSMLRQKKIQAHLLLDDEVSNKLFERSTLTVKDMLNWVRYVLAKIQEDSLSDADSLSVVKKVQRYIGQHLTEMPSREELANLVFLNPDYLTRLFKKETGMTLIGYAQYLRIEYAKDLLAKTDISITKVATKIGYSNFSHFTRAFKEMTGLSPTDYKNQVKNK